MRSILYLSIIIAIVAIATVSAAQPKPRFHVSSDLDLSSSQPSSILLNTISFWSDITMGSQSGIPDDHAQYDAFILQSAPTKHIIRIKEILLNKDIYKPILFLNLQTNHKEHLCNAIHACYKGESYAYAVFPFTDSNGKVHHKVMDWSTKSANGTNEAVIEFFNSDLQELMNHPSRDKYLSDTPSSMIPAVTGAIYRVFLGSVYGSYNVNLDQYNKPGKQQTIQHRIDNTYFNYRVNGTMNGSNGQFNGRIIVVNQDGIISPSTPVSSDQNAAGFFQYYFQLTNSPYYVNAQIDPSQFFWMATNPITINQQTQRTTSVTNSISLSFDISVNQDGPSVSGGFSASTSITNSVTSEISDWGIQETTQPIESNTQWSYHMQYPYDIFSLGEDNFGSWWSKAYSSNKVIQPPDLSMNSLQLHTSSAWFSSDSIDSPTMGIKHSREHRVGYVANPNVLNSHHYLVSGNDNFNDNFEWDVTYYP
eukprot:gene6536-7569_t